MERILSAKLANPGADTRAGASLAEAMRRRKREIDDRVYRLYGLTPEEIKLVEEGASK